MTPETYALMAARGGGVDLSARAKFLLTGGDRIRYLNGQVTNDVRLATKDATLHACVTNAKGRIEGDIYIHAAQAGGEGLWLDAEAGLREPLGLRLERYIVADDVELRDVTEEWKLWHFFGPAAEIARSVTLPSGGAFLNSVRFGAPGVDVWMPAVETGFAVPPGIAALPREELETWRICRGVPCWPAELNPEAFPQEAGLEEKSMSFSKGCYIGQEILSRIKMSGKTPRKLVTFVAQEAAGMPGTGAGQSAAADLALYSQDGEAAPKEAGRVTSITRHPGLDRVAGLAYVRQGFESRDSLLLGGENPPRIFAKVDISTP